MKKQKPLLTLLLILCSCVPLPAQSYNAVSLTFSDTDLGLGGRYDHQFKNWGFYAGAGRGHYKSYATGTIHHDRISAGVVRYLNNYALPDVLTYLSLGGGYHIYKIENEGFKKVDQKLLYPLSLEIGVGITMFEKLIVGWTYDPFKRSAVVQCGYRFKGKQMKRKYCK